MGQIPLNSQVICAKEMQFEINNTIRKVLFQIKFNKSNANLKF